MNHTLSKVKVYQTEDYKRFRFIEGNRNINLAKVERIINEILSGNDILDESPAIVSENGKYLDVKEGQHRVIIAEKLKRPAHYIIKNEKLSLYNIAKINSNVEKWKFDDFINCYVKAGNNNYKKLKEFRDQNGISTGVCITLLMQGTMKSDGGAKHGFIQQFQQGTFEVKFLKEAKMIVEICKSFEPFEGITGRPFIIAICKILDAGKCEMNVLIEKYKKNPSRLVVKHRWKEYLTLLQEIYNTGNSKQRVIY